LQTGIIHHRVTMLSQLSFGRRYFFNTICVDLSFFTLYVYDWLLTLPDEVRYIWETRPCISGISVLFAVNRYVVLLGWIPIFVISVSGVYAINGLGDFVIASPKGASAFRVIIFTMAIVSQCISTAVMILRVFALYRRNIWVLALTSLFGCVALSVTLWSSISQVRHKAVGISFQSAVLNTPVTWSGNTAIVIWAGIPTIAFDVLVFALVVFKGFLLYKSQKILGRMGQKSLAQVILEDGSLYFLSMAIVNVLDFLIMADFLTIGGAPITLSAVGSNTFPSISVSTIIVSRVVLNLRRKACRTDPGDLTTESATPERSSIAFHGPSGESLTMSHLSESSES